jgi:hypothetical protein
MIRAEKSAKQLNTFKLTQYLNLGTIEMQQVQHYCDSPSLLRSTQKTSIIYESRGRAREYCELAANLYRGCGHGCEYCYAPAAIHMARDEFYHPPLGKMYYRSLKKMQES